MKRILSKLALSLVFVLVTIGQLSAILVSDGSKFNGYINNIKNLALYKVILARKEKEDAIQVDSNSSMQVSIKIPFISINKYMREFVKNIPFTPKKAIKLEIKNKSYFIWANESGIICAPDPKDFDNIAQWNTKTLFSVDKEIDINPLRFVMQIDKLGQISMGKSSN